ncbi:MAG: two-CW domain-containing protein [Thermoplasmatota archaeon]
MKRNCWEYRKCGRQPGGDRVNDDGECPVSSCEVFDGRNSGKMGGRYCWRVANTKCSSQETKAVPNWASKMKDCLSCDFFDLVRKEEGEEMDI